MTRHGQEVLELDAAHCIYRGVRRRAKGWRMAPDGVCCTRPGEYSNPWPVTPTCPAEMAVEEFEAYLRDNIALHGPAVVLGNLVAKHRQHGSLTLYCFCDLKDPCHCSVLADALVAELERLESAK